MKPDVGGRGGPRWFILMAMASSMTWALAACGPREDPGPGGAPGDLAGGVMEGVLPEPGLDPVLPDPAPAGPLGVPEPPGLAGLAADTVRGWTGPGEVPFEVSLRTSGASAHLHQQIGLETFPLAARITDGVMTQYPCTACHQGTMTTGDLPVERHPDVRSLHPGGAECALCHVPGQVDRLVVRGMEPPTLDHAYQLCAQCHFSETNAWAAGVHGKRLEGWAGRRVVMNCADCHNPHEPALDPRIPYPAPRIP